MLHAQFITAAGAKKFVLSTYFINQTCVFHCSLWSSRGREGERHISSVGNVWWSKLQPLCHRAEKQLTEQMSSAMMDHRTCFWSYLVPPASPWDLLLRWEPPRSWRDAPGSHPHCRHKQTAVRSWSTYEEDMVPLRNKAFNEFTWSSVWSEANGDRGTILHLHLRGCWNNAPVTPLDIVRDSLGLLQLFFTGKSLNMVTKAGIWNQTVMFFYPQPSVFCAWT